MTATGPPPVVNRIAGYMNPAPLPVSETPEGKRDAWGDALFAAAMFYRSRLAHPDPEVAERAARAIFDLEKAHLRHGRELAGTEVETPKPAETREERKEMPTRAEIQRLGKVVELAMKFDADEDDDGATEEELKDDEIVERFARTEAFSGPRRVGPAVHLVAGLAGPGRFSNSS